MDKTFLYIMLSVAIILIIILAMSQNRTSKQPADLLNEMLASPTPAINLTQQPPATNLTTTTLKNTATNSAIQTLAGGLKIQDIVLGAGQEVKEGNTVTVHYKGTLENGIQFDSSYDRGEPFKTKIGVGEVIEGWDLGIIGMKVGGKRILAIPPDLGYGNQQVGKIPPSSTLIFEVEIVNIEQGS